MPSQLSQLQPNESKQLILRLIGLLETRERTLFRHWLLGELKGKKDHKELRLWDKLVKLQEMERVRQHMFPDTPKSKDKFYRICNKLQQRLEIFMAYREFRKNETLRDTYLLKNLIAKDHTLQGESGWTKNRKADLENVFPIVYRKVNKRLEDRPARDVAYFRALAER